jgi:ABC-type amino acid transport substrate-binding protein
MGWLTGRLYRIGFHVRIVGIVVAMLLIVGSSIEAVFADTVDVAYPGTHSADDKRVDYYVKLLDLVLGKTGVQYLLHQNDAPLVSPRAIQRLEANDGVTVIWAPTTRELEQRLMPIRIPLDKGILGWRLFLIKARDRRKFEEVQSLAQLKSYSAGLQRYWSDSDILQANGLKVVDATLYESLFDMLAADRFQYFPRGVGEIWNEESSHAHLGLEIEQHLALHYPADTYFFVNKRNATLAHLIERGLHAAKKDGSFDKLFDQYNGEAIKRAKLNSRTVLELSNPLLPQQTTPHQNEVLNYR